jgi:molybdopterin synthase catalytic subunit
MARILVQAEDFDPGAELVRLTGTGPEAGAVACFIGTVRSNAARPITAMALEHYPGMTQAAIARIAAIAEARFSLLACTVIHRHGLLRPADRIVLAAAAAPHRQAALDAVGFLMDWLKTRAPFWKKEFFPDGTSCWVEASGADDAAASRWEAGG